MSEGEMINGSDIANELWRRRYQVYSSLGNGHTQNARDDRRARRRPQHSASWGIPGLGLSCECYLGSLTTDEGVANHAVQEMTGRSCELRIDSAAISSWAVQSIGSLLGPSRFCSRQKEVLLE